mgnify:CR=1 FL=1
MEHRFTLELWKYVKKKKTMVLWTKLWHYGKNDGTMDNTMVLWKKNMVQYRDYIELRLTKDKKHVRLPKTKKL